MDKTDKMHIGTGFMKGILAGILSKALEKAFGIKIETTINFVDIEHDKDSGQISVALSCNAKIPATQLKDLLSKKGVL